MHWVVSSHLIFFDAFVLTVVIRVIVTIQKVLKSIINANQIQNRIYLQIMTCHNVVLESVLIFRVFSCIVGYLLFTLGFIPAILLFPLFSFLFLVLLSLLNFLIINRMIIFRSLIIVDFTILGVYFEYGYVMVSVPSLFCFLFLLALVLTFFIIDKLFNFAILHTLKAVHFLLFSGCHLITSYPSNNSNL